jgi:hypothetical protein
MVPTYSVSEVKSLIISLDIPEIEILSGLVNDEKRCYQSYEFRAIQRMMRIRKKSLQVNELQLEYLLSFN